MVRILFALIRRPKLSSVSPRRLARALSQRERIWRRIWKALQHVSLFLSTLAFANVGLFQRRQSS